MTNIPTIHAIPLSRYVYGTIPCNCHGTIEAGVWMRIYCTMHAPRILHRNARVQN